MKAKIIILVILFLSLSSVIALAVPCTTCPQTASASIEAKPGSIIALKLKDYELTTNGLVITPSWKPAFVKWYLIDPTGSIKYMVQGNLNSVIQTGSGFNSATWKINADSGIMKIPAFATAGNWAVKAKIYDINNIFIIQWSNEAETTLGTVHVVDSSIVDSISAPLCIYWNVLGSEISFATPDLIFLILIIVVIIIALVNIRAFLRRKK